MTAIQSRTALQPQYPAADTKKIQKLNETSFAWKTARVVAVVALIAGVLKVASYYSEHTSPPRTDTSSAQRFGGPKYSTSTIEESTVTWLGDVTKKFESQSFKEGDLYATSKQTIFSPLFGDPIIVDCRKDIKLDLETCLTITDRGLQNSRLNKQCVTYKSSEPDCYTFEYGWPILDQSISDLHEELKDPYVQAAKYAAEEA